ncbi:hypothetical protein ACEPPN_015099 [Leptodophora sp. 'Broadleaf-Isolate-01']
MNNQSQRSPLNQETLSQVPLGPSKLDTYLQQEYNHESLLLGLPGKRENAGEQLKKLDEEWKEAEKGTNSGN